MDVTIECQKRPEGSKPRALRRDGLIPAVLYGHNGVESVDLTVKAKSAETLLKDASVNNTLIQVNVPDISWSGKAILREVQAHPWKRKILYHLSFFSVASQDSLDLVVPIHYVGEPVGVKEGGILQPILTELAIQCAPDNIPEVIEVDVTNLNVGDSLQLENVTLPSGVTSQIELERTIVTIVTPQAATEEPTEALSDEVAAAMEAYSGEEETPPSEAASESEA